MHEPDNMKLLKQCVAVSIPKTYIIFIETCVFHQIFCSLNHFYTNALCIGILVEISRIHKTKRIKQFFIWLLHLTNLCQTTRKYDFLFKILRIKKKPNLGDKNTQSEAMISVQCVLNFWLCRIQRKTIFQPFSTVMFNILQIHFYLSKTRDIKNL